MVTFLVGVAAGSVVTVVVPAVFRWVSKQLSDVGF